MSSRAHGERPEPSAPRRALRSDFTERTMRYASTAKRRATTKQQLQAFYKELFTMKSMKALRTVPGAALAFAVLATGSVGVYALTNWFGGDVTVTQNDPSIISVDVTKCKGFTDIFPFPLSTNQALNDVKFKITGDKHVSAQDLQNQLLALCEQRSIQEFYGSKFPVGVGVLNNEYAMLPATVKAIGNNTVTLFYTTGAKNAGDTSKTFTLSVDATVYNQGQAASLADIHEGDTVMFVAYASGASQHAEGTSVMDESNVRIVSLFKAQYDIQTPLMYDVDNIMPLDQYDQLHQ